MGAMKRFAPMMILLLTLAACGRGAASEDALALEARTQYLEMSTCGGEVLLTADYGDRMYEYTVSFTWQQGGEMALEITAPQELQGVKARIAPGETYLEYDGASLETGPLDTMGLSPMAGAFETLKELQGGYIASACSERLGERDCLRLNLQDPQSQAGEGRGTVIWLEKESNQLIQSELTQEGATLLRCQFLSFTRE